MTSTLLLHNSPWTKPPFGARPTVNHSPPNGGLWLFNEPSQFSYAGGGVSDAMGLNRPGLITGTTGIKQASMGPFVPMGYSFTGGAGKIVIQPGGGIDNLARGPMMVSFFILPAGAANGGIILDKSDGNVTNGGWWVQMGASNTNINIFWERGTTNGNVGTNATLSTTFPTHVVVTSRAPMTVGTTQIYYNGVAQNISLDTTGTGTVINDTALTLQMGVFKGSTVNGKVALNAILDFVMLDHRWWGPGEVMDLYLNPFGMFDRRIWFNPGSTGAIYTWQWL